MIVLIGKFGDREELVKWLGAQVSEPVESVPTLDEGCEKFPQAQIIIGSATKRLSEQHLERWPHLRWYHALSAGVDDLPLEAFAQRGIVLTNSSGIHGIPMGEHILGMMLMFSRNLHSYVRNQTEQEWSPDYPKLGELYGKTLCIVGAGSIGKAVAQRARAFGMKVVGVKRRATPLEGFDKVISTAALHEVLPESDYVLLLTPLTKETYHFFGADELKQMKSSAILLTFARGAVVDEEALVNALADNEIGGAGLDVFEKEPLSANHPLWRFDNVIITPHLAGISPLYNKRALEVFVENYRAWKAGESLPTGVDLTLGY